MWSRITLRVRIYLILVALALISLIGGGVTVWYTYRIGGLVTDITEKNLAAFQAAEALETALVNQKGFVSYYFLDGDPDWLRQLGEYRQIFKERLHKAHTLAENDQQKNALKQIKSEYTDYITAKDQVIDFYKTGERNTGAELHRKVRDQFFRIFLLCENYKDLHTQRIKQVRQESDNRAKKLRVTAAAGIITAVFLALFLAFVLASQVLGPVRRLAAEADRKGGKEEAENEIKALSRSVRGLIDDVDQTQFELEKSREHLLQAEKMALVGNLAAGMAHSIRNPFTSVKMRLFSLSRSLEMSDDQKEDFEVISEEIRHIDTIVQNFLEFSRPPKLKMQQISPSTIVDSVIQLLGHRLKSYDVSIKINRSRLLPGIQADPEQLKEVMINIIVNACEAIKKGGLIIVNEKQAFSKTFGKVAEIRLSDNGPGIPEAIIDKVLQPFFTTKVEGTGLGLSIAARIVEEHGGQLAVASREGQGTTFIITLPVKEMSVEHHSHY
jgi:signal transduction histidine kinase